MPKNPLQNILTVFCLIISFSLLTHAEKIKFHLDESISPAIQKNSGLILTEKPAKPIVNQNLPTENGSDQKQSTVQWPQKDQQYYIYSALNPRMVLDIAKADDGSHDLILYKRQNTSNQKYSFRKTKDNQYHILNSKTGEFMKKSHKLAVFQTGSYSRIKFSKGQDKTWRLIPAKSNLPNSFYIVSDDDMAIDVAQAYAMPGANIIEYDFHKNINQVWILKNIKSSIPPLENIPQIVDQVASKMLYDVFSTPQSIIQAMKLQNLKEELKKKKFDKPQWLDQRPLKPEVEAYDIPFETTYQQFWKMTQNDEKKEIKTPQIEQTTENVGSQKENQQLTTIEEQPLKKPKKSSSLLSLDLQFVSIQCAKNNNITYVWMGDKPLPREYSYMLQKCQQNVILIKDHDYVVYVDKWNLMYPSNPIPSQMPIRQQVNLIKLLHLYFESGIYADFDTQINEPCWQEVFSDQIVFTSRIDDNKDGTFVMPIVQIIVPEESFMMVRDKLNPQVKRMIEEEIMEHDIGGGDRWRQCKYRQCLIVECQRHYRDNTYKKGYD